MRLGSADTTDPGYMGFYPIGPECRKKLPAEYVHDSDAPLYR